VPSLLTFESVSKSYGSNKAVDGLSFSVPERSVVGLLGPNGAGKSTAMKIVLGLASANSGEVSLFGASPGSAAFAAAVRRTGSHIETPALYERASARGNLEIHAAGHGISRRDPRIDRVLETVGLSARSGDRVKSFSLGMRQRMSLAIAILHEPELVILDEPTNGLDPAGVVEIREVIRSLPERGMTVLVSSHVLSEIERPVDEVVIIRDGRLVTEGPIDEVIGAGAGALLVRVPAGMGEAASGALAAAGFAGRADGDVLRVEPSGKPGSAIAEALASAGVFPDELRPDGTSLEDVFLQLTADSPGPDAADRVAGEA